MTDSQLIIAARRGDSQAWRELYTRWMPWVWRCAYALVQDAHAAEDVTSEAMTAWVRNFHTTGTDAPQAAAWLRSVVRHKCADHHRRGARFRKAAEGVAQTLEWDAVERPSDNLSHCERRDQVEQAMATLKQRHRLVLEWKYAEGMSVRQIAERLGATEKSVEASLYRARREFRQAYLELEPSEPDGLEPLASAWPLKNENDALSSPDAKGGRE
ncbi:ECF RNA polymerase sigma factor SigL [Posidoniimonas polymericola]|uniref:ECF RNA polymerase sigma factor SigL n=1 Tax=Posidoniimonas polymericola TaxID=2528002 RepID=A0A5C5XXX6_9BACT|nr:sigma-70 family RNA polymerase sigma factor [Posidoniimonas polymericola]TWT66765.1 ECF RNA polymerase sigma factor SigL [Posidoniimonas polymericola]